MEILLIAFGPFVVVMILVVAFLPRRKCPTCGEPLPRLRVPTSRRQLWHGGWTCPGCGCELDRQGRKMGP